MYQKETCKDAKAKNVEMMGMLCSSQKDIYLIEKT